jgi:formylglycine-generating enzyme required for sulfatase activity
MPLKVFIDELARVFYEQDAAKLLARSAGFPPADLPDFKTPRVFWSRIIQAFLDGKREDGVRAVAVAAAIQYPANSIFVRYRTWQELESFSPLGDGSVDPPRAAHLAPWAVLLTVGGLAVAGIAISEGHSEGQGATKTPAFGADSSERSTSTDKGSLGANLGEEPEGTAHRKNGMVYVPAGQFPRGNTDFQGRLDDCRNAYGDDCSARTFAREASHARTVAVPAFLIDEREVTNAELAAFMTKLHASGKATIVPELGLKIAGTRSDRALVSFAFSRDERFKGHPYQAFAGNEKTLAPTTDMAVRPATLVAWDLAFLYCREQGKRLPTETEWEYAARGPQGQEYVWSDRPITCREAAYGRLPLVHDNGYIECRNEEKRPNPVGKSERDRSWCGALDMGANVSEWVADAYVDEDAGCPSSEASSEAAEATLCHVYKGGNWIDPLQFARAAYRPVAPPGYRGVAIGFRCALSLEHPP